MILLQALTAFFAVIGLFEVCWQAILCFTRRSIKKSRARILVQTEEDTDPAFLAEDLRILSNRLTECRDLQVWLICPKQAKQEAYCRYIAERNEAVRIFPPEELNEEISLFLRDL